MHFAVDSWRAVSCPTLTALSKHELWILQFDQGYRCLQSEWRYLHNMFLLSQVWTCSWFLGCSEWLILWLWNSGIWQTINMSLLFIACALQFESFYSIFTTEQQDHVKSVEYLRNNYRPTQELHNRFVFKSAVKDAWLPDPMADGHASSTDTETSKGKRKLKDWMLRTYSMPLNAYKGLT